MRATINPRHKRCWCGRRATHVEWHWEFKGFTFSCDKHTEGLIESGGDKVNAEVGSKAKAASG